jgi:hypothetical protein
VFGASWADEPSDGEGRLPVAHLLINRKRITGEQAKKAREKVRKRLKAEEKKNR